MTWTHSGVPSAVTDACNKIDSEAVDGLEGVNNSLAYKVEEIERHFHSYESWFGQATTPDGEVHVADRIGDDDGPFQADAGNDEWGDWLQILGSDDTPARTGEVKLDLHRFLFTATERNATYFIQVANGDSGAAGLAAGDYTEAVFQPVSNQIDSGPIDVQERRKDVGTKYWFRTKCPGEDTATIDFYFGLHEYEG